jgi:hypothetical protein
MNSKGGVEPRFCLLLFKDQMIYLIQIEASMQIADTYIPYVDVVHIARVPPTSSASRQTSVSVAQARSSSAYLRSDDSVLLCSHKYANLLAHGCSKRHMRFAYSSSIFASPVFRMVRIYYSILY